MLKNSIIVGAGNFLSKILGLVREIFTIYLFGASSNTDAYFVAMQIPNVFRQILSENGFNNIFIPQLKHYHDPEKKKIFINQMFMWFMIATIVIFAIIVLFSPLFVMLYASGFEYNSQKFDLTVDLVKVSAVFFIFIVMTGFLTSIFHDKFNFFTPSATQILMNVGMLSSMAVLYYFSHSVYVLAFSALIGIMLNFFSSWFFLRKIHKFEFSKPVLSDDIKKMLIVGFPLLIASSMYALSGFITTHFASLLGDKVVSWFMYVSRLNMIPLGILATAVGTVILPHLAEYNSKKDHKNLKRALSWSMGVISISVLPATFALTMLSIPILTTLFYYGAATLDDISSMSFILKISSFSIFLSCMNKVISTSLMSQQETKFVLKTSFILLPISIFIYWFFSIAYGIAGLAIAPIIATIIGISFTIKKLHSKKSIGIEKSFVIFTLKGLIASCIMIGLLYQFDISLDTWKIYSLYERVYHLTLLILAGIFTYGISLFIMGFRIHHLRYSYVK